MNTAIEQIDVITKLSQEDFLTLFIGQLPLEKAEIEKIRDLYYGTYITFISSGVTPEEAWIAIRNLFISQETQIGERIKNGHKRIISGGG
jgi:hypothetical protein